MSGRVAPLIVLTRPKGKNVSMASWLRGQGASVLELPALQLQPVAVIPDQVPRPRDFDLLVFVSSMALSAYESALDHVADMPAPGQPLQRPRFVAGVGLATAAALRQSRWFAQCQLLMPQTGQTSDSEGLWPQIQINLKHIHSALVVRGQTGREWLGQQLESCGVSVTRHASYQRTAAVWSSSQVQQLRQSISALPPSDVSWLMTSSEGVDAIFAQLAKHNLLDALQGARFVAVHERIGRHLKWRYAECFPGSPEPEVTLCEPDAPAMCQSLLALASI